MAGMIDARSLKTALSEPGEIALLDVRETGAYSDGHPFHVVPLAMILKILLAPLLLRLLS